jgi:hypothetical protein
MNIPFVNWFLVTIDGLKSHQHKVIAMSSVKAARQWLNQIQFMTVKNFRTLIVHFTNASIDKCVCSARRSSSKD